jgi:hypothetical protein
MHITLAPTWFDPAETGALLTPYICLRALHDALVKPMPDGHMAPCLATRWHESADGLTYDFEQNLENLRRTCYAPHVMGKTNVLRSPGAPPCVPSKAIFPLVR